MQRPNSMQRVVLRTVLLLAVAATLGCLASSAWACPSCGDGIAGSPQGRGLASGLYYSIIFMMSMPFIVFGTVGTVFYRSVRRAQAERDAAAAAAGLADVDPRV
jgi:Na+-driven multidrug efflux pump